MPHKKAGAKKIMSPAMYKKMEKMEKEPLARVKAKAKKRK